MIPTLFRRAAAALAVVASLGAAALPGTADASTTLRLLPSVTTIAPGGAFDVDVVLGPLADGTDVGFFDLDVLFDPAVVSFSSVTLGDALGRVSLGEAVDASLPADPVAGVLNLSVLSLLQAIDQQPATAVLGTLRFTALGLGDAGLDFGFTAAETPGGLSIALLGEGAQVAVVPEPGEIALMLAGLGVLALRARRRHA